MTTDLDWRARAAQAQARECNLPSPCISVCVMEAGLCKGCWRTLDEIAAWSTLADTGKRAVWALIAQRAAAKELSP